MSDIVERLRDHDRHVRGRLIEGLPDLCIDDMIEAADEIERLREALCDCHHVLHKLMAIVPGNDAAVDEMAKVMKKARAALGEGKE